MAKDERQLALAIDPYDFPYSDKRHFPAFVYLIWWPTESGLIAKAGISRTTRRWRHFLGRGAQLAGLWQAERWNVVEARLLASLAAAGTPAFELRADGLELLGGSGGHTECFRVESPDAHSVISRIALEVTGG